MTLVVLAAGMGSRYGGLKQLDPMTKHGEFIIDFSVYDAIRAGYTKVVFIVKRENYSLFRETIGRRIEKVIDVAYVFQGLEDVPAPLRDYVPADRVKPLGTGHALLCARLAVDGKFAVINADDYYGVEAYRLAKDYMTTVSDGHFCMVGYALCNTLTENGTVSRGICQADESAFLTSITERTKIRHCADMTGAEYLEGDTWHPLDYTSIASMNFFGFDPTIFECAAAGFEKFLKDPNTDRMKGEYFLPTIVSEMRLSGKCDVKVLPTPDKWHGVTYHEDKDEVVSCIDALIRRGVYPDGLWK